MKMRGVMLLVALMVCAALAFGTSQVMAAGQMGAGPQVKGSMSNMGKITAAQRRAAATRAALVRATSGLKGPLGSASSLSSALRPLASPPSTSPDYFGIYPNYANSPLPELDAKGNPVIGTGIRKFVDSLPGLTAAGANNLGQYLPVAVPDTTTYPGSDYYVIALVQYTEKLHSDLPATTLRGYVQLNSSGHQVTPPNYLGPTIVAQRNRAVRVKFVNQLPTNAGGDLFLPVDKTVMGAGMGPLGDAGGNYSENRATLHLHGGVTPWISDGTPHQWITPAGENTAYPKGVSVQNVPDMPDPGPGAATFFYTNQQSARLMFYHDHSYGITRLNVYAGEAAGYILRDKFENALVNGGEFKDGTDTTVTVSAGTIPSAEMPLIIQDKTFVPKPAQLAAEDPTWKWLGYGNLWLPHVYMPNQNPYDVEGVNAMGRWDYGPWFWPPYTGLTYGPVPNPYASQAGEPPQIPGTPNPSIVPEAFMDTPLVNGTPYPFVKVSRKAYRFRILNASNDRSLNLSLFFAKSNQPTFAGVFMPIYRFYNIPNGTHFYTASASERDHIIATLAASYRYEGVAFSINTSDPDNVSPLYRFYNFTNGSHFYTASAAEKASVIAHLSSTYRYEGVAFNISVVPTGNTPVYRFYNLRNGSHFYTADSAEKANIIAHLASTYRYEGVGFYIGPGKVVLQTDSGDVPMVAASPHPGDSAWPSSWPTDGRDGGVPSPQSAGPSWIQIGTEGGFLPSATVTPAQPINYNYNRRDIVVLNVSNKSLFLGPAERADVIVDFSGVPAGSKLILYNDAPAPVPAFDPRYDYYTGDPDQTESGGAPTTLAGYGPNTRTVMQFQVDGSTPAAPFNVHKLQTALIAAFGGSEDKPIVSEPVYGPVYGKTFKQQSVAIQDTTMTVAGIDSVQSVVMQLQPKAIQELFDPDYGRMNATLGVEVPNTNVNVQTTIPYFYVDPTTETIKNSDSAAPLGTLKDGTQIWKITHNGVDTHAIHVHLFNMQLINRVGWDGAIRLPDPNELGWKDTIRMNPLEDAIVALRPIAPTLPFKVPDSWRLMNVTEPTGSPVGFSNLDPNTGNPITPPITNQLVNYGWEYVWHCHLLGHEENDMMRPIAFQVSPAAPTNLSASNASGVTLAWTNNATWPEETSFTVQRATDDAFSSGLASYTTTDTASFVDSSTADSTTYSYRVRAENAVSYSVWSNTAHVTTP